MALEIKITKTDWLANLAYEDLILNEPNPFNDDTNDDEDEYSKATKVAWETHEDWN
jgi:hypothetical protein